MTRTFDDRYRVGETLAMAINTKDYEGLRALLHDDCEWIVPGSEKNPLSGNRKGADVMIERWQGLDKAKLVLFVQHVCVNFQGDIALIFHNWGIRGEKRMNEHLCTLVTTDKNGLVTRVESYLSDIDGLFNFA